MPRRWGSLEIADRLSSTAPTVIFHNFFNFFIKASFARHWDTDSCVSDQEPPHYPMNYRNPTSVRTSARSGMTLLELTVVILVLLSLISVLFVGSQAWKHGSDRAGCILQISQVQHGVRSFANLYGYVAEQNVAPLDLNSEVIGPGKFVENSPDCPGSGTYSFKPNEIPKIGSIYMTCSLKTNENHQPQPPHNSW